MGGLMTALDFLRQGRTNFVILERYDSWGGTTWRDVANETTKLQTENAQMGRARFLSTSKRG